VLPSGEEFVTDRGAEQGDAFGTVQSCLTLAGERTPAISALAHRQLPAADAVSHVPCCEEWFIDDGQAFVKPQHLDPWLRALDASIARFGGTRVRVDDDTAKSSCRLLCPPDQRHLHEGWATRYVCETTKVLQAEDHTLALGAPFGGETALLAEVGSTLDKAARTHRALLDISHAPTELVLTRQCGDVAKLSYHLRLNGDRIPDHLLETFDRDLRASLEHILGGSLPDNAWEQSGTGVCHGGLGLRTARQVSLAAFVASRVSARPHVREMATHLAQAGVCDMSAVMLAYDGRTEDAVVDLVATLPAAVGAALVDTLDAVAKDAVNTWASLFQDDEASQGGGTMVERAQHAGRPQRLGAGIVPLDEDEDAEHPAFYVPPVTGLGMHLQHILLGYSDRHLRERMLARGGTAQDLPALRRLNDLADPECDHNWLWNLSRHRGPVLQPAQYVEAVRVRLGAAGPSEPVLCRRCRRELLDSAGSHAHCCSLGEATRGAPRGRKADLRRGCA